jgi:hypothetical protein
MKKSFAVVMAVWLLLGASVCAMAQQAAKQQSKATTDIIKMASAGVGDDVLLSYVKSSPTPFNLSADDIIALKEAKVGAAVVQAMLAHDATAAPTGAASASTNNNTAPAVNPDPGAAPAPLAEAVPVAPGSDYQWVPGYWTWDGGTWVWVYGVWQPRVYFGWHRRLWW